MHYTLYVCIYILDTIYIYIKLYTIYIHYILYVCIYILDTIYIYHHILYVYIYILDTIYIYILLYTICICISVGEGRPHEKVNHKTWPAGAAGGGFSAPGEHGSSWMVCYEKSTCFMGKSPFWMVKSTISMVNH